MAGAVGLRIHSLNNRETPVICQTPRWELVSGWMRVGVHRHTSPCSDRGCFVLWRQTCQRVNK